ncbi:VOC family protein [Fulvimarina sp. 2208YS6-2-32]|uniref:VOC family protein n=1 Tax=Fulvimarina uroteuthidis TaxID=3098149 RepID=A0ABU5I197_9HYPH|nr:VOC family protein [Fulvimarina sp. 2208YS6-2-32]MDY8109154.1 VOC family protein [Fulvimarina sp. 2208YS6-2-32]
MRSLDHVVMPFGALGEAQSWFSSLGFTLAPEARHPFGTANACVFFRDGLFIEPLARVDEAACAAADRDGNLFVRRDAALRADPAFGFSALALRSKDALADRDSLGLEGLTEEATLDFGRTLTLPDGSEGKIAFRLAFVKDFGPRTPSLFLCEPRHSFTPDRSRLTVHENGATGLAGLEFATTDIEAAEAYLRAVFAAEGHETEDGSVRFDLDNGFVDLVEVGGADLPALSLNAAFVAVSDPTAARALLDGKGIDFEVEGDSLAVPCPNGAGRVQFIGAAGS